MKKTSERLAMTNGAAPSDDKVHELESGIFIRKGPEFHEKFMAGIYCHKRSEVAMMILASDIQKSGTTPDVAAAREEQEGYMRDIWIMADDFILTERETLDERMKDYWAFYMESNKNTDEVMAAMVDESIDYSA